MRLTLLGCLRGGGNGEHEAQAQILDMLQTLSRSTIDIFTVHWVEEGMCNSWEPILWLYTEKYIATRTPGL